MSLRNWSWDWRRKGKWFEPSIIVDLSNRNKLHGHVDWWDAGTWTCWVDWSNGHSDPVWCVHLAVTVPRWILRLDDRRRAR